MAERSSRFGEWQGVVQDWGPVVVVALVSMAGVGLENPWTGTRSGLALTGLATAVPLGWRRSRPLWAGAGVGLALVVQVHLAGGSLHFGSFCAVVVVTFSIGRYAATRGPAIVGAVGVGFFVIVAQFLELRESPADIVFPLFYMTAAWAVGRGIRVLHQQAVRLRELNEALERDRDSRARLAVAEERMHLARELHDVVGHTVTLMVVQAAAAEETLDEDPVATRRSLVAIQAAGRRGMDDLRSVVDVLAEPDTVPVESLDALVDRMAAAGLHLDLRAGTALDHVGHPVSTVVLRLVQESLTNVLRHSHAREVTVLVAHEQEDLQVRVTDAGPARAAPSSVAGGRGLANMRARVEQLGGQVQAGPRGDGFEVVARLPVGSLG